MVTRITVTGNNHLPQVRGSDIPMGQIFRGKIGHYPNKLFRRYYKLIVGLDCDNGDSVWNTIDGLTVENYEPVKEVNIVVL